MKEMITGGLFLSFFFASFIGKYSKYLLARFQQDLAKSTYGAFRGSLPHQLSLLRKRISISVKVRTAGPVWSEFFRWGPASVVRNPDHFHL